MGYDTDWVCRQGLPECRLLTDRPISSRVAGDSGAVFHAAIRVVFSASILAGEFHEPS